MIYMYARGKRGNESERGEVTYINGYVNICICIKNREFKVGMLAYLL